MLKKNLVFILLAALAAGCGDDKNSGPVPPDPATVGSWRDADNEFMKLAAKTTSDACNGFAVNDEGVAVHMYKVQEDGQVMLVKTVKNGKYTFQKIGEIHALEFTPSENYEKEFITFDPQTVLGAEPKEIKFTASVDDQILKIDGFITYQANAKKVATLNLPTRNFVNVTDAEDLLLSQATSCSLLSSGAAPITP